MREVFSSVDDNSAPVAQFLKSFFSKWFVLLDLGLLAIPSVVGAGLTAAAKKADVDAFFAAYANNIATLAAKWNAALNAGSPGQGPLHVVAG